MAEKSLTSQELERQLAELRQGDHLCMVYESQAEQMAAAVPFLRDGLDRGECCVYIADEQTIDQIASALAAAGVDVPHEMERGALALLTKRDSYLRSGEFDPRGMVEFLRECVEKAVAAGFSGFRVTGEMTWALGTEVGCNRLIEYEAMLNEFFPGSRALAICQYNRKRFPAAIVRDVLRTHPIAVLGNQICRNLYYEAPDLVLRPGQDERRVEWMISQLKTFQAAEQRLQELNARLNEQASSLAAEVDRRRQTEEQLRTLNETLEHRIAERTAALAQANQELARSNADLEQFAYVASHDLQEPVRMVSSFTQLLARRYRGKLDEQADQFIAFAVDGAARMQTLINDLLVYSRAGRKGEDFRRIESAAVVQQAVGNLQAAIRENGAVVTWDSLPTVMGDATQLTQVFQNLIGNAIKYRRPEEPPRIDVSAVQQQNEWVFAIRDNGIGIEPQHSERIFQIFQRLHARDEYTGTGIGLAICRKIVERHGGRIWVESQPGQGSVFYFTLPSNEGVAP